MNNRDIFVIVNDKEIIIKAGRKFENHEFCIISNQELYDLNQNKISFEEVLELYKNKVELANVISNTFTIIIIDKMNNTLTCIQDTNNDTVPVYYYNNTEIIFTNKLLNIILNCSKEFKMNKESISSFIRKGYIPNKKTLVKNIYKMIPKYNLAINLNNKKEKFIKKKIKYNEIKNCNTDLYIEEFKKILEVNSKDKDIFTTLSNGYDSNFIYSFFDKEKSIEAFSVGGIEGTDETKQVQENIEDDINTNLNIAYVNENTLENYPDIIYTLEGAIYEKGIFLQYELVNSIRKKQIDNAVLYAGEGADQIFSLEYFDDIRYFIRITKIFLHKLFNPSYLEQAGGNFCLNSRYNALYYVISKKSGILMNDIGINYIYPYLYKNIINVAYCNRYNNAYDKKSHKEACKKQINSNILKNIAKIGGTTDPSALFKNCSYIQEIEELVNKSKFNILKIKKDSFFDEYQEYLLKVLYLEVFEHLFIEHVEDIDYQRKLDLSTIIKQKYINEIDERMETIV